MNARGIHSLVILVCMQGNIGCATIVMGTTQEVSIASDPSDAIVRVSDIEARTPARLRLSRSQEHDIVVEKEGYLPAFDSVRSVATGTILGNILFGGLIGVAMDTATGASRKLVPSEVHVTLQPDLTWQPVDEDDGHASAAEDADGANATEARDIAADAAQ